LDEISFYPSIKQYFPIIFYLESKFHICSAGQQKGEITAIKGNGIDLTRMVIGRKRNRRLWKSKFKKSSR